MWSQLRAIWTFSALHNRIEKRQQFLDIAAQIWKFCQKHGRDDKGRWVFRVDRDGKIVEGEKTIYVDGFAIIGLSEYIKATDDPEARKLAIETFESVENRLPKPGSYLTFPYEIPAGLKVHGVSMIFSYAFDELAQATGDARIASAALREANLVMDHFRHPERKALMEFVRPDGSTEDSPAGRCIVPGHAIESMWFQIHQYERLGMRDRVSQAIDCIRWHMDRGWDKELGGIFLGLDIDGEEPVYWKFHDTKLWWPQTEALYALLKAYTISKEQWCLDWYWKVHDICFKHYPVKEHGEWTQKLDRRFNKITDVVALPVKDPFHLPRALILAVELLRR
jgi:N-acylglucosamine 2-epimerase